MFKSPRSSPVITPPINGADFLEEENYSYRCGQSPSASQRDIQKLPRTEEGLLESASFSPSPMFQILIFCA
ncbi:hypothetical protein AYI69_g9223 [Smittium culicis]|uniref:Uncharacterized protein n=1 Tax=Smittium culicis TaxID=133412 RepID=A0A1R1XE71_9FUNG|nr:hypothetical protein AYI69_g9223 [Smittium culicis]